MRSRPTSIKRQLSGIPSGVLLAPCCFFGPYGLDTCVGTRTRSVRARSVRWVSLCRARFRCFIVVRWFGLFCFFVARLRGFSRSSSRFFLIRLVVMQSMCMCIDSSAYCAAIQNNRCSCLVPKGVIRKQSYLNVLEGRALLLLCGNRVHHLHMSGSPGMPTQSAAAGAGPMHDHCIYLAAMQRGLVSSPPFFPGPQVTHAYRMGHPYNTQHLSMISGSLPPGMGAPQTAGHHRPPHPPPQAALPVLDATVETQVSQCMPVTPRPRSAFQMTNPSCPPLTVLWGACGAMASVL